MNKTENSVWIGVFLSLGGLFVWFLFALANADEGQRIRRDRMCEREQLIKCLDAARSPQTTHYTDQEETVNACASVAKDMCRRAK